MANTSLFIPINTATTTGTGNVVLQTSPTLITPVLGAATGTSIVLSGNMRAATYNVGASAGVDASITTADLVGKTITVSKGVITGYA